MKCHYHSRSKIKQHLVYPSRSCWLSWYIHIIYGLRYKIIPCGVTGTSRTTELTWSDSASADIQPDLKKISISTKAGYYQVLPHIWRLCCQKHEYSAGILLGKGWTNGWRSYKVTSTLKCGAITYWCSICVILAPHQLLTICYISNSGKKVLGLLLLIWYVMHDVKLHVYIKRASRSIVLNV